MSLENSIALPTVFIEQLASMPETAHLYALIDGAQDTDFYKKIAYYCRDLPLFTLIKNDQTNFESPPAGGYVLRLLSPSVESRLLTLILEELRSNRTNISFFISHTPIEELVAYLRWLTDVKHEDNTEWIMRYYDTRILPLWLNILTPKQRTLALAPIQQWAYLDPRYAWQIIKGGDEIDITCPSTPMLQSEKQVSALIAACAPHILHIQLQNSAPVLLEKIDKKEQIHWVHMQIENAKNYGLKDMNDLENFCLLQLECGEKALTKSPVREFLARKNKPGEFTDMIANLEPADWDNLGQ